jgi:hypothetical protein
MGVQPSVMSMLINCERCRITHVVDECGPVYAIFKDEPRALYPWEIVGNEKHPVDLEQYFKTLQSEEF